jgi:hypothetical protein
MGRLGIAREARKHRPEICFPAAGYQPCGDDSPEKAEAAFRREIVKLIEVKTNGLVDHASTR